MLYYILQALTLEHIERTGHKPLTKMLSSFDCQICTYLITAEEEFIKFHDKHLNLLNNENN